MSNQILLSQIPLDELLERIKSELQPLFASSQLSTQSTEETLLTAKETAKLLGVSLVSIHHWKKEGKLKFYRYGSRIRFKKSEVLQVNKYSKKVNQ